MKELAKIPMEAGALDADEEGQKPLEGDLIMKELAKIAMQATDEIDALPPQKPSCGENQLCDLDDYFDAVAGTEDGGRPLVIAFTAEWCPTCKKMKPVYEKLGPLYPELDFRKVDVDDNHPSGQAAGIDSMPTFIVYMNGEEVKRMSGGKKKKLRAILDQA